MSDLGTSIGVVGEGGPKKFITVGLDSLADLWELIVACSST